MNYEDRVTKAAVEAAIEGVKLEYVTGSYTGNNGESRIINLGFTPKAVFLVPRTGLVMGQDIIMGGFAVPGLPMSDYFSYIALGIVENGFQVGHKMNDVRTNENSTEYYYLAVK